MKITSVLKNESTEKNILWKHYDEDFNNNTILIVGESEEVLFYDDGVIIESFTSGRYTLNTNNYPFLKGLRKMFHGGKNPYHCKVFFIDKTHQLEVLWGTDSPIQIRDANYGFAVSIRARGSYSFKVNNAKKLIVKLLGNNVDIVSNDNLTKYFKSSFQSTIKDILANYMTNSKLTVLDMSSKLKDVALEVKPELLIVLEEYGLNLVNFYITDISIPENDPNYELINKSYAQKAVLDIQKDDFERISQKEILKDIANNPSSGSLAGLGAGLGLGINATNTVKEMNMSKEANKKTCTNCDNENDLSSKYCNNCGNEFIKEVYCTKCGSKQDPSSNFCKDCGRKI